MPKSAEATKTVLVIEDNEISCRLFHDYLIVNGYKVLVANDATEGLKVAKKHKPDLLLVDVNLFGMSGIELARTLRQFKEFHKTPIIAITALSTDKGDIELGNSFNAVLEKPITLSEFSKAIKKFI